MGLGFHKSYLKPTQLERLKLHKYCSKGTSLFEVFMQPYWCWLVTKLPLWLAPNLVTFIGFLINVITTLPVILLDKNAQGLAPGWSYISCGVGFFIYQTLDAIDGKQARRTSSNTPLGELFDHGCDAISTFLVVLTAVSSIAVHDYPFAMLGFVVVLFLLAFCYHWQTYVSGILFFNKIDVTEAQFLHIFMLLVTGFFGAEIWQYKLPYLEVPIRVVIVVVAYGTTLINTIMAFRIIFTSGVGKNGSTVADTSILSPLLILVFQVPIIFIYPMHSPHPLNNYCMLYFTATVFPMIKSCIHMLVASMTKSPLPLFDFIMVGPFLAYANVYFNTPIPEVLVLAMVSVYNVTDVIYMCVSLCQEICTFLNISCFTIAHSANRR